MEDTEKSRIYNLNLFRVYNKEKRGLNILGWFRWYDENSNTITTTNPETRDIGGHTLVEGVRYRIKHKTPVSYLFPEREELAVVDVAEIEGTLSLENYEFRGPELLEAKLFLINQKDSSKRVEASVKRTLLVLCMSDKVENLGLR